MKKTALITGSSRGIGRALAFAFGRAGYNIVLNGGKDALALEETKKAMEQENIPVLAYLGDVSDYANCTELFRQAQETFGDVDVLINNAGIAHVGLFTDMTPSEWARVMNVNLSSVFHCTHLAVPPMVRKKAGCIINISSVWGICGASCEAVYSASKGGVNAFTKSMAKELAPSGIRVNAIACGVIETQMNEIFDEAEKNALCEEIPLQRFGRAEEVAALALFLANEGSAYLTGQIIPLDGGMIS